MSGEDNKVKPEPIGRCRVPMWSGLGVPSGHCNEPAYGQYIDGPKFRDGWTGELKRLDGKRIFYASGPCCPRHGGPDQFEPRVYQDGHSPEGYAMYCAVHWDFENLQESPAEFHTKPWVAIRELVSKHPIPAPPVSQ